MLLPCPKLQEKEEAMNVADFVHQLFEWVWSGFVFLRTARKAHIIPLRRFLEAILQQDLRNFFSETCFEVRYTLCIIVLANVLLFATEDQTLVGHSSLSSIDWQNLTLHAEG